MMAKKLLNKGAGATAATTPPMITPAMIGTIQGFSTPTGSVPRARCAR